MSESSWPFDGVDTTETQFSQWARNIGEGVKGSIATSDLKAFGDSSGMNVKLPAGQAMVRGHYYSNTAQLTLTIPTAHATLPRIDSIILELDPAANTIVSKVLAGTPASTPVATALTQTDAGIWQQLLATVAVGAAVSTIAVGNVTDARSFLQGVTVSGTQTLTNKTLTAPVIATISNGGTLTLPTGADTLVGRATVDTLSNKTLAAPRELFTNVATANGSSPLQYDVLTQTDLYLAGGSTSNFVVNFRGNSTTTLNTTLAVNQTMTVTLRVWNSATTAYVTGITIDSTTISTPNLRWQGGVTPTSGNASSIDVYTFAITKTATGYLVYASQVKFA